MEIRIPLAGSEMFDGEIVEWLVEDGATVERGQPLYLLSTDKVEIEIEAPSSGRIRLIGAVGVTYQVGTLVAQID